MAAPAKSNGMTIALIVAIAAFLVAAVAAFIFYRQRQRRSRSATPSNPGQNSCQA